MAWTLCPSDIKNNCRKQFLFKGVSKIWVQVMRESRQKDDRIVSVPFPGPDVHPWQNYHIRMGQYGWSIMPSIKHSSSFILFLIKGTNCLSCLFCLPVCNFISLSSSLKPYKLYHSTNPITLSAPISVHSSEVLNWEKKEPEICFCT